MIENNDKLFIIYKVTLHQWLRINAGPRKLIASDQNSLHVAKKFFSDWI